MVERHLAKVEVAGSSPVIRSNKRVRKPLSYPFFKKRRHSQAVRQRSAKPSSPVRFRVAPPSQTPPFAGVFFCDGGVTPHRTGLRPRSARSGIRSASAARRSTSSLVRRRARGYSPQAKFRACPSNRIFLFDKPGNGDHYLDYLTFLPLGAHFLNNLKLR